jgi:hypothetical protein
MGEASREPRKHSGQQHDREPVPPTDPGDHQRETQTQQAPGEEPDPGGEPGRVGGPHGTEVRLRHAVADGEGLVEGNPDGQGVDREAVAVGHPRAAGAVPQPGHQDGDHRYQFVRRDERHDTQIHQPHGPKRKPLWHGQDGDAVQQHDDHHDTAGEAYLPGRGEGARRGSDRQLGQVCGARRVGLGRSEPAPVEPLQPGGCEGAERGGHEYPAYRHQIRWHGMSSRFRGPARSPERRSERRRQHGCCGECGRRGVADPAGQDLPRPRPR